ncbi:50S ribosomal protein L24 [Ktedonobacter racemifer]
MSVKKKEKKPLHLAKMNIKKGDTVLIITGKDKSKEGTVSRALPQDRKVIVEGLNVVKKHVKPQGQTRQGGIIEKAMPLHVSNVMLKCTECNEPTRVGHERRVMGDKERSVRICKHCGKVIQDRTRSS